MPIDFYRSLIFTSSVTEIQLGKVIAHFVPLTHYDVVPVTPRQLALNMQELFVPYLFDAHIVNHKTMNYYIEQKLLCAKLTSCTTSVFSVLHFFRSSKKIYRTPDKGCHPR